MANAKTLFLYDSNTCERYGEVASDGMDVFFPDEINGWSDVLDCRIPPYDERSLEENCEYAVGVRKFYILVTESQIAQETPPTARDVTT